MHCWIQKKSALNLLQLQLGTITAELTAFNAMLDIASVTEMETHGDDAHTPPVQLQLTSGTAQSVPTVEV